jgi:hypothetical protein
LSSELGRSAALQHVDASGIAAVPVRARVGAGFVGNGAAATLSIEDEVVVVAADDGRELFRHGRFDTALGWLGTVRGNVRFRLSSTCDEQVRLSAGYRHADELRAIERWLHLDGW